MSEQKFCPKCGTKLLVEDRFCNECGYDFNAPSPIKEEEIPIITSETSSNKNLIIVISLVVLALSLTGGGLYWWLSRANSDYENIKTEAEQPEVLPLDPVVLEDDLPEEPSEPVEKVEPVEPIEPVEPAEVQIDLSQAASFLPQDGLKCTFDVSYPDGDFGVVDRVSGLGLASDLIKISEAEIVNIDGEEYASVVHYTERPDGVYQIMDGFEEDLFPVLKNDLRVGQTWDYRDEFGTIAWTVLETGAEVQLGFNTFVDCIVVEEDNQAVGFQSVIYYAPDYGSVYVTSLGGGTEYYRMTAMTMIDAQEAADIIIKWSVD